MQSVADTSECSRVGGKVIFNFTFSDDPDKIGPEQLHRMYYEDVVLQRFINGLKELRGKVYQLMKD
jgi:hypothetical protein